tara:strand:- start:242 stop:445 length:204 start_codon:yes stop_codon:yes gene_type:complete
MPTIGGKPVGSESNMNYPSNSDQKSKSQKSFQALGALIPFFFMKEYIVESATTVLAVISTMSSLEDK